MTTRSRCFNLMLVISLVAAAIGIPMTAQATSALQPVAPLEIRLQRVAFDPLIREPSLPSNLTLSSYPGDGTGYYLVQFKGPILSEWKAALQKQGTVVLDYIPQFAYIVRMNKALSVQIKSFSFVRWVGVYQPAFRLSTDLDDALTNAKPGENVRIIARSFTGESKDKWLKELAGLGAKLSSIGEDSGGGTIVKLELPTTALPQVAQLNGTAWVEPWAEPILHNGIARSDLAMNKNGVEARLGLYGAGQIVVGGDTGVSTGATATMHDDFKGHFYKGTWGSGTCGSWADSNEHGTHTAGSVLGNGVRSGAITATHSYSGSNAGIAPEALLWAWAFCSDWSGLPDTDPYTDYFAVMHSDDPRVRINTNSWGYNTTAGTYNAFSREMDRFIWDHQDMSVFFSAGNDGTDANDDGIVDSGSMGVPGGAKNVVTVGASENYRMSGGYNPGGDCDSWGDCWPSDYGTNPVRDDLLSDDTLGMVAFSSRGPTLDGRLKPDVVAPGSNIVSTRYQGSGTGWGVYDAYYLYMGGTSMATPLTAGGGAVVREYYSVTHGITNPTAALVKATLINGARDMTPGQYRDEVPDGSKDDVIRRPDVNQGWGRVDLYRSLVHDLPDQLWFYEHTGLTTTQEYVTSFVISSNQHPFRVTLAWSDYPGTEAANGGLVNDLDLTVVAPDGNTYNGNDLIGDGLLDGDVDHVNNVEGLDFTQLGVYTVRVRAYNTPQGPQPFALVVSGEMGGEIGTLNGTVSDALSGDPVSEAHIQAQAAITQTGGTSSAPDGSYSMVLPVATYTVTASAAGYEPAQVTGVSIVSGTTTTQNLVLDPLPLLEVAGVLVSGGDGDGILEPGETANLSVGLDNVGFLTATNVSGVLTSGNIHATILSGSSAYADIAPSATVTNTTLFQVRLDGGFVCGASLQLSLTVSTDNGPFFLVVNVPTTPSVVQTTYVGTDVPRSIPDGSTVGATSLLTVTDSYALGDVDVTVSIEHAYDADLDIYLVSPTGITVELSTDNGGGDDNYTNTVFDDEAASAITAGSAPFTGRYRPEGLLSTFDGQNSAGTWKLFVIDDDGGVVGTITAFSLTFTAAPVCDVPVPLLTRNGQMYSDVGGNNDGLIFPGESNLTAQVGVFNGGTASATNVNGVLTALTPGVTIVTSTAPYANIGVGSLVTNSLDFGFDVDSSVTCGANLTFGFTANASEGIYDTGTFVFPTGLRQTAAYTNSTSLSIPDNTTVLSTITIPASPRPVSDVKVLININHTYDGDVDIFLVSPSGTRVELTTDNGGTGENFVDTIFDDDAPTSITDGTAPFTGSYRPETALSAVDGQSVGGTWTLEVSDDASGDTGTLLNWSLMIQTIKCADAASLTLNKSVSAVTVQPGEQFTYTLTTQSTGELDSTNVVLSDILPANVTYVSSSDGGVFSSGVVTWTVGTIPAGTVVTRTLTVQVNTGVANGTILSNTFTVLSAELPAQTSNTAATTVVAFPSMVVEATEVTSGQPVNQIVTQTLTISNVGTAPLTWNFQELAPTHLEIVNPNFPTGNTAKQRMVVPATKVKEPMAPLANIIQDGSFELGSPNAAWDEYSLQFDTPLCNPNPSPAGCGTGNGTAGPHTGNWWAWFGGTDGIETSYVTQTVIIASGSSAQLSFWLRIGAVGDGTNDVLHVLLDSTVIFSATKDAAGYSSYAQVVSDVSAFADGQPHVLRFESTTNDTTTSAVTNFNVDDIVLDVTGPTCSANALPWVAAVPVSGTIAPDSSSDVGIVFDSTGLSSGIYTGTLCLYTNDPIKPETFLPVTMTVVLPQANLAVNIVGSGDVIRTPAPPYAVGEVVTLTAVPDPGWAFSGWSGDLTGSTNPAAITLTGNNVVTATFVSTCVPVAGVDFTYAPLTPKVGQPVTFNATAMTGTAPITYTWNFGDSSAPGSGSPVTHTFPLVAAQSYTVTLTAENACGSAPVAKVLQIQPLAVFLPLITR